MLEKLEWWGMIKDYNTTLYPLQIIVMAVAFILSLWYALDKQDRMDVPLKVYLGLTNLWIGMMFFWIMGKELGNTRIPQGVLFVAIGALFLYDIFAKKLSLRLSKNKSERIITVVLLLIVMAYPFVGMLLGRDYDAIIYVGMLPCATTAFGLVLVSASLPKRNLLLYILLLIWAIPFPPLVQIPKYQVYEDGIMFLIGIYALVRLIVNLVYQMKLKKGLH